CAPTRASTGQGLPLMSRECFVIIDQNADGELVYSVFPEQPKPLELASEQHQFPVWEFAHACALEEPLVVRVYGRALRTFPTGENLEEIHARAVACIWESGW